MIKFFNSLQDNLKEIFSNPLSLATLFALITLILIFIKIKKVKLDTKIIARIGIALALATILHFIKIVDLPNGAGSINLGSMLPIIVISFIYGPQIGMLTGFLFGVIYLLISPYILHPLQVLFDYPLPFMAIGLAGYFKNKKYLGIFIAMSIEFFFHFISGYLFFGQYAPEGWSPALYSLIVNVSVVYGNLLIVLILFKALPFNKFITNNEVLNQ